MKKLNSQNSLIITILTILSMTLFSTFGGLFLKKSSESFTNIFSLLKNKYFYLGGIFFSLGAVINIFALRFIPYSIVMPLKSFTYIWTAIIASIFLKENINKYKTTGIFLIVLGAFFISR